MLLDEHFRCADGIAEYFNGEFYEGSLCLCCETGRTDNSVLNGLKPGMEWIDAAGGDQINTANGFQGGECDVILFLLGLNDNRKHGEEWYITSAENKYIYTVSVSRAKHLFIAFGDKKRVFASGLSYIQKLIPEARPPRKVSIGPGEERLRVALERAGILTEPQYPIAGRYFDLAIPSHKIDIEVDGQAWHLDRNGCRKADDIHRDILMEALGWYVIRFWHYQVVNDIGACVNSVRHSISRFSMRDLTM